MAIITAITQKQITKKETSSELKFPTGTKTLEYEFDDSQFIDGSVDTLIECDYGDGKGFIFEACAKGIDAGFKNKDGRPPFLEVPFEDIILDRKLFQYRIPIKVRISIIPVSGTPIVGLKTNAEEII